MAGTGWGTWGKGPSPSASSFLQIVIGPHQEKLSPLSFLKLGNQVQPGGAGKEWVGPKGRGPVCRGEGTGGHGLEAENWRERVRGTRGRDPVPRVGQDWGKALLSPGTGSIKEISNTEPRVDPCPPAPTPAPDMSLQELRGQPALKKALGDCKAAPTPEQTRRLAKAMMAFTTDLFSMVAQRSTSPNLVLSPLSVALALSHLALGTVAAPVQTSGAGRTAGTHYFRVTPLSGSLGHLVEMQIPGPTSGFCESDSQGLGPGICFW